jgi:hypothetical protein
MAHATHHGASRPAWTLAGPRCAGTTSHYCCLSSPPLRLIPIQPPTANRLQAWVSGKVEQLLGVKEPTLVDYVVKLLAQATSAAALAVELNPVLDSDTETFVIKLYRTVIYETEKASMGL